MLTENGPYICEFCNSYIDVEYREDPFAAEIEGDFTRHYICDKCYAELCDEI